MYLCNTFFSLWRVSLLKDEMVAQAVNVRIFTPSRAEILKHKNARSFFFNLLYQSNKMLEGTVSTPVKKQLCL